MHFEFKSTFRSGLSGLRWIGFVKYILHTLRRHAAILLAVNISSVALLLYFYLENQFIPAVYGSKPTGDIWINVFETMGVIWLATTLYAGITLITRLPFTRVIARLALATLRSLHGNLSIAARHLIIHIFIMITPALRILDRKKSLGLLGPDHKTHHNRYEN